MIRTLVLLFVLSIGFASHNVSATTLGEITVHSAVGEPFSATIEVYLTGNDSADRMRTGIAPQEVHAAFGIIYAEYSATIRIDVVQRDDKLLLILASDKILREAFLEFIFELQFMSGSIYRAYSVLPEFNVPDLDGSTRRASALQQLRRKVSAGPYTVQNLDSFWLIAAAMDRNLGNVKKRISLLEAANPQVNNGEIHPGDTIYIPSSESDATGQVALAQAAP